LLAPLADMDTWLRVAAERAVSRAMGGSCSMPLAAHAVLEDGVLDLRAAWGDPEGGTTLVRAHAQTRTLDLASAEALGLDVAGQLRAGGAR